MAVGRVAGREPEVACAEGGAALPPGMHRAVIVVTLAACGHAGSTPPAPANRPPAGAPIVGPPWRQAIAEGVVGVVGDRLFAWDREFDGGGGGIAERDVAEGRLVRTRAIDGLRINGVPEYWEAVPGGYLAQWDAPTLVRERGDQLAVAWTGAGGLVRVTFD